MSVPTMSADGTSPPDASTTPSGSPDVATATWAWPALLVAGAAWLVLAWTVLRVEPTEISWWAGAAVLFGAASETLRAVSGARLWWLHAGLASLFTVTAAVIMIDQDASLVTPTALVGWYLLVRGAVDVTTAAVSRGSETAWALLLAIGMIESGLGFWASSSFARATDVLILLVGALALMRGLAELTAALSARAAVGPAWLPAQRTQPAQAPGTAGYTAGMADFAAATTARSGRAKHRAAGSTTSTSTSGITTSGMAVGSAMTADAPDQSQPETTADLDAMLALAGVSGAAMPGGFRVPAGPPAGMSIDKTLPEDAAQGSQTETVRISPAAAGVPVSMPPAHGGDIPGDSRLPTA